MRKVMMMLCLAISIGWAAAQTKVTGVVVSSDNGEPVIGASIVVKGTTTGTVTDVDGKFSLTVPQGIKTLVVSYIGMTTKDEVVRPSMRIALVPSTQNLNEVMVVAYGTANKKSFTGSASVVKAENLEKLQTSNVSKALEGQVAGVQITSNTGQPGSTASIRIRGIGSINASSEPLIVVDGMPYDGDLNSISQQDIESMTVLKDAASNALYGARGANGVVLITTKKGVSGKVRITVDAKMGQNSRAIPEYSILTSPVEYYETYWEAMKNNYIALGQTDALAGQSASTNLVSKLGYNVTSVGDAQIINPATGKFNSAGNILYHDDWGKEMFKNNGRQEYNVNISGSKEKTTYYLSFGYLDDKGYIENSDFKRYSSRVKLESELNSWFKVGGNFSYINTQTNSPSFSSTSGVNMFYASRIVAPIYPIYARDAQGNKTYDSKGRLIYDYGTNPARPVLSMTNPLGTQSLDKNNYDADVFNGVMFGEISFLKDFKATFKAGLDNSAVRRIEYQNGEYGQFVAQGGSSTITNNNLRTLNLQELLSWKKKINDHSFDVLLGHESYSYDYNYLSASKNKFLYPDSYELDNAILNPSASSGNNAYKTEGYLSRLEYNYLDKYYASLSYRRDASSRFGKDNRWGNFWSVGGSWRMKEESFLKGAEWLSNLKYKISYGAQGNDALPNLYPYLDQYTVVNNAGQLATTLYYKGNPNIKWETNYNFNTGFEFGFFDNRLEGGIEVFERKVEDMLFNRPVASSAGYTSYPDNIGSMRNRGFEVELKGQIIKTNNLKWSATINATSFKNKILSLPPERKVTGIVNGLFKMVEGKSVYEYYTKEYAGVESTTGKAMWYMDVKDANGNVTSKTTTTTYSQASDYFQGSALPDLYGGFSTALETYGFDFSINCSYQIGGKGYDGIYATLMNSGDPGRNWSTDIRKRWTPTNTATDVPKVQDGETYASSSSSRFFINASYLSLQNVTLGYTLPTQWVKKAGIESIRFYVVGDNIALWSKRKGYDPRQNWTGASGDFNYSPIRTVSGGIQVKF